MKIATFNINNVNKRLPISWIGCARRGRMCLPAGAEGDDPEFPIAAIGKAGYAPSGAGKNRGMVSRYSRARRARRNAHRAAR